MGRARKENGGEVVQSVERALLLLELISKESQVISLSNLAKKAQLKTTTAYRLINTLKSRNFVEQDQVSLKYRLGLKALEISNVALATNDFRTLFHPFLADLARQLDETINLAILDGTEVVYIDQIESTKAVVVKMFAGIGSRGPAYCTGTGKVLLANLPESILRERFAGITFIRYTNYTVTDLDKLIAILAKIKARGFAVDISERDLGVTCVAVPVRNRDGQVQAAVSVSAPEHRMAPERIEKEILPALFKVASMVSEKLGFYR